jgi:DNA topoisomerase-1
MPYKRQDGQIIPEPQKTAFDVKCPSCGSGMVLKRGRFGEFLGCSRYPDCSGTMPIPSGVKCPKENCGGEIVAKRTKKGRTFFGCSNYPNCDFVSWNKPVAEPCESCGSPYLLEKNSRDGTKLICPSCKAVSSKEGA